MDVCCPDGGYPLLRNGPDRTVGINSKRIAESPRNAFGLA